jgi:Saxitoxin biosynthesis operon protein SxtJ
MAAGVPARLTAAEGRKFGVTVGLAFVAIGLLLYWRGKHTKAMVVLTIGGLFVVAGLLVPTYLGPVERAWMALAHMMSKVTTPIFMGIVYFVVMMPTGFIRRAFGSPIVPERERAASRWQAHTPAEALGEQMERQF